MEKKKVCDYCGHVRCDTCLLERWPSLVDGCCECRKRILSRSPKGYVEEVREIPRLYGPGLRLVRPAASPFGGYPKGKSLSRIECRFRLSLDFIGGSGVRQGRNAAGLPKPSQSRAKVGRLQ